MCLGVWQVAQFRCPLCGGSLVWGRVALLVVGIDITSHAVLLRRRARGRCPMARAAHAADGRGYAKPLDTLGVLGTGTGKDPMRAVSETRAVQKVAHL